MNAAGDSELQIKLTLPCGQCIVSDNGESEIMKFP